jgi:hypothetical protein
MQIIATFAPPIPQASRAYQKRQLGYSGVKNAIRMNLARHAKDNLFIAYTAYFTDCDSMRESCSQLNTATSILQII